MSCNFPQTMYRVKTGRNRENGKWPLTTNPTEGFLELKVTIPCGTCIECKLEKSRQWAVRCQHQTTSSDDNCYITLTYAPEHLPKDGSLDVTHFQKFMKRLRARYPLKIIKFFHCGEYGEQLERPHYHAILFNFNFTDRILYQVNNQTGIQLDTSKELEKIWGKGFVTIGNATFESAAYVARYVTKKINGKQAQNHYNGKKPEYITMSQGIGLEWFQKYKSDIYTNDRIVVRNKFITKVPRYYDKKLEQENPNWFKKIKKQRRIAAANKNRDDDTPERRLVKDKCKQLKINNTLKRKYEHNE